MNNKSRRSRTEGSASFFVKFEFILFDLIERMSNGFKTFDTYQF
jgi:hypothetical protein